jgi:hypothetical protein
MPASGKLLKKDFIINTNERKPAASYGLQVPFLILHVKRLAYGAFINSRAIVCARSIISHTDKSMTYSVSD